MRSIGVAIAHPDPRVVDELVHAVEAARDLYLALDPAKAAVFVAGAEALRSLGAERAAGVAVVGLAADGDVASVARAALACGAQGLVCWPADRDGFRPTVREAASRAQLRAGGVEGRLIAVAGGRGGVGTTTAAALLARGIADAVLVDLDPVGGGQANFLAPDTEPTFREVLGAIDDLDAAAFASAFVAHAAGRALCTAPRGPSPSADQATRLVELLRATAPLSVCDVGRGGDPPARAILGAADVVVCVCGPDVPSLRGARALSEELGRPLRAVLNGATRFRLGPRDVARVLGARPDVVVPADPGVRRAGEAGKLPARGPARRSLEKFGRSLMKELLGGR